MNPALILIVSLRAAALAASLANRTNQANALYAAADLAESGVAVDAHMGEIAAKLKDRHVEDADWADVHARIQADADRLQSG